MTVKYKVFEKEITEQQASRLKDYDKLYVSSNGLVKKREEIRSGEIIDIDYYLDTGETEQQAKQVLIPLNKPYNILNREIYGSYTIENGNGYTAGSSVVASKYKKLLNSNNETVCIQQLDIQTNQPVFEHTGKYIGEYIDERSTHYCEFYYNPDGSLEHCEFNYMHDYDSEWFHQSNIHEIRNYFVLSDAMYNYYLTADFLPPLA
ncbi:hypothetical protein Pedsa_0527 [Pseudopedobacter saltans DSM 12145]|uniref:Uncharacterized protein n=1 Tax=Pseudopedobacter saltans (strain ATCC 51119 / DSM 12145 / JCM 21818 / CCUG 39354 / LMG 10337 / NBRC 100064 / NCIMB 13643) TaxID=762903 RepID=F0S6N2_PSESL|nr:hypothetical protein [Pseudopedobacter saltans]ADY51108.1 hypothetical protein Pedsa_0527 [Pseudopedobacter saltans DSM 12145]